MFPAHSTVVQCTSLHSKNKKTYYHIKKTLFFFLIIKKFDVNDYLFIPNQPL